MKLKCVVVDDELNAVTHLEECISKVAILDLVKSFSDSSEAFEYLSDLEEKLDILFLDIQMPKMNGLELASMINSKVKYIIIVSGYIEYLADSFEANARRFLTKPYDQKKFELQLNGIIRLAESEIRIITLGEGETKVFTVNIDNLIAAESCNHHLILYYPDGHSVHFYKISQLETDLRPSNLFLRVNKSWLVAKNAIRSSDANTIYLKKNMKVAIGDTYKDAYKKYRRGE